MSGRGEDHTYEFGDWLIEPHLNRIGRGDEEKQLEPRTMDVLAYLVEHAGEIVSAEALLETVWSGRIVEPNAIHRNVNQIRRALGDDSRHPRYIETVSKRGYRAVATVTVRMSHERDPHLFSALEAITPPFPAYVGDAPYVFVCYAHVDRKAVYAEIVHLRDAGVNIWYDEGISPGSPWTEELANAINGCAQFLYYVTPASVASPNCLDELQYARERRKTLVAAHLEKAILPEGLKLSIGRTQALYKYELPPSDYERM